jgi:hypothetical protein
MSEPFDFPHAPPAVTRYFEKKDVKPSFDWRDFSFDEHAHSFTVAKSAGFDVARDIRDALAKAIREGQDFKQFQSELEPTLRAKGWWGKKLVVDPETGELVKAQLGSAARLRTIYNANIRAAYAAGAWERAQATKRVLPYLEYVISTAMHKREEHLAWVGTILPVDDDWWATHYPPNGWNCQCRTRQISEWEAESRGYKPDEPAPRPQDFGEETYINKRTGEVTRAPGGIDPGWAGNPGLTRQQNAVNLLAGKIDAMPPAARDAAISDIANNWLSRRIMSGAIPHDRDDRDPAVVARGQIATPIAVLPDEIREQIGAQTSIVRYSVSTAIKQLAEERDRRYYTPDDYGRLQTMMIVGEVVQLAPNVVRVQYDFPDGPWRAIVRRAASAPDEVYLTSFHRIGARKLKRAQGDQLEGE